MHNEGATVPVGIERPTRFRHDPSTAFGQEYQETDGLENTLQARMGKMESVGGVKGENLCIYKNG
ncbi:hypothetical protein N7456_005870 [Penicillium angulare]|uniref:Uncharacterized protein n=1 Tax=Penicillium angulare TaxID=116970 RepID=A0A9W9FZB2_9EURO|nr:hypothetical protein N7456_005870 [Penicillium angulare]